ncbi:MAG: transposase, partial [Planctomycetes bacterium]|nr:transposase [Planctomycetota bacterium]
MSNTPRRRVYDLAGHLHFVTFSCYGRRRLLQQDSAKRIVVARLSATCEKYGGYCVGFVLMPEHVHAILGFRKEGVLSLFMQEWKRLSAVGLRGLLERQGSPVLKYLTDARGRVHVWQRKYYDLLLFRDEKVQEKLQYMHGNPVSRGLTATPGQWPWSSASWYEQGKSVGVEMTTWEGLNVSGATHTP